MKRKATRNFNLRIKLEGNKWKTVTLVEGKVITPAQLKELSPRHIRDYTEPVEEVDISFLSTEDKRYYRKHKDHPDMQWALDILSYPPATE